MNTVMRGRGSSHVLIILTANTLENFSASLGVCRLHFWNNELVVYIYIYTHIIFGAMWTELEYVCSQSGYRVSFPQVKRPGRGVDHPPPSRAEVKERVELYLYSPSGPSWPVLG